VRVRLWIKKRHPSSPSHAHLPSPTLTLTLTHSATITLKNCKYYYH
jgi:hypothetical protein